MIVVYGLAFLAKELKKVKPKKEFKLGKNPDGFSEDFAAARGWGSYTERRGQRAKLVHTESGSVLIGKVFSNNGIYTGYAVEIEAGIYVALQSPGKWDYYKEVK